MRGGKLIFAAVMAATLAITGTARAEDNFFEALGKIFSGNGDAGYNNGVLYPEDVSPNRIVPFEFRRQTVRYNTTEAPGTIIIDTSRHYLYFVTGFGQAIRYGVGVGRTGMGWKGTVRIGNKAEWPTWHPPKEMIAREAKRGHKLPLVMAGGRGNRSAHAPCISTARAATPASAFTARASRGRSGSTSRRVASAWSTTMSSISIRALASAPRSS